MGEIKKGKTYVCIEDWHKLGTSFTKGKIYKCHKDGCMYDDFGAEKASVESLFKPLKECKQEVEERIAKTNAAKAIEMILEKFDATDRMLSVLLYIWEDLNSRAERTSKSVYTFHIDGRIFGCHASVFIIDLNPYRENAFINSIKRRYKKRFNFFEFETFDDCVIAFD